MPEEYADLVEDLKELQQDGVTLPVAENGWNTRPDADSYGVVQLDFEADALYGDNGKRVRAFEGSVDLYSRAKSGDGWIPLIEAALEEPCETVWQLNHNSYEDDTRLFHWEWVFQVEGW